jgi:ABC-type phosphate transport system substrate-binding protein
VFETEQVADPDLKWVPLGAFAGLVLVLCVAAATAGNATAAATTIATVRNLFMDRSPLSIWGSDFLLPVTVAARPQE